MQLADVIETLEGKIEILELDHYFVNEKCDSPLLDKIYKLAENYQVIQQLIAAKQEAIETAQEINAKLREYINILEKSANIPHSEHQSENDKQPFELLNHMSESVDWSNVPKYMRGKLTCEKVNEYIDSLNGIATDLMKLQRTPYNKLTKDQKDRLMDYKSAASYCPNDTSEKVFLLESEVKRLTGKTELALRALNTILRHCAKIREVRGGGHNRIIFQ